LILRDTVPLIDVGDLVAEDRSKFRLRLQELQHPCKHKDMPAGHGESVHIGLVDGVEVICDARAPYVRGDRAPHCADVGRPSAFVRRKLRADLVAEAYLASIGYAGRLERQAVAIPKSMAPEFEDGREIGLLIHFAEG